MPATPLPAVFLSYAREDAEAARRIADALRTAGIAVCFEENEKRGGEAWETRIRRQIKECTVFVPVISAHTQARREGFFRLEWRLADERMRAMARGGIFIVPVCIDNTPNQEAEAPDSFLEVQWSRLIGGEVSQDFVEHLRLLGVCGEPQITPAPFRITLPPPETPAWPLPPPDRISDGRRQRWLLVGTLVAAAVVVLVVVWLQK
jgi:hypothetical protein